MPLIQNIFNAVVTLLCAILHVMWKNDSWLNLFFKFLFLTIAFVGVLLILNSLGFVIRI